MNHALIDLLSAFVAVVCFCLTTLLYLQMMEEKTQA